MGGTELSLMPRPEVASFSHWPLQVRATTGDKSRPLLPTVRAIHSEPNTTTSSHPYVFLGGACNPTTWRREVAIPLLEAAGVDFYNPQVDEWYEELIDLERQAMETATVLLNVIDDTTRALVSINEAVEHVVRGHQVVLVVEDILPGTHIEGDDVSQDERTELNAARERLRRLAYTNDVPVCSSVRTAVLEAIRLVRDSRHCVDKEANDSGLETQRLHERSTIVLSEWLGPRVRPQLRRTLSESSVASLAVASTPTSSGKGTKRSLSAPPPTSDELQQQHWVRVCNSEKRGGRGAVVSFVGNAVSWRDNGATQLLQRAGIPFVAPVGDYLTFAPSTRSSRAVHMDQQSVVATAERSNTEVRESRLTVSPLLPRSNDNLTFVT